MCYQVTIWGSNLVLKYYEPFYQKELQTLMSQKYRFGAQQWSCEERWWGNCCGYVGTVTLFLRQWLDSAAEQQECCRIALTAVVTSHTLSLKSWAVNLSVSLTQFTSKDRKTLPIFYVACSPGFLLHFSQLFFFFFLPIHSWIVLKYFLIVADIWICLIIAA